MGLVRFVSGLFVGLLVGGAAALLFAPRSGEETVAMLRERAELVIEDGRRAAQERKAELEAQFAEAKRPVRLG